MRGLIAGGLLLLAGAAAAQPAAEAAAEASAEPVPLDRLLQLPAGAPVQANVERRGGMTRNEWEKRFADSRRELREAEQALARTRAELEDKVQDEGGAWRAGAPGLGSTKATDSPLDYRLTQMLRRQREELARAERRLQDLGVEANLAGVPPEWRGEGEVEAEAATP